MKHLKWLLFVPIAALPYCFVGLVIFSESEQAVELCAPVFAVAFVAALTVFFTRSHWTAMELSLGVLVVKVLHIFPFLFLSFVVGVAGLLPYWASLAEPSNMRNTVIVLECLALLFMAAGLLLYAFFSGLPASLVGLAAVLRCRKEGRLTHNQAVAYGILQFVFLADVVCAILLCRAAFKKEES